MSSVRARRVAPVLWLTLLLFSLRVAGQVLVEFFGVSFLPPSSSWQSGLLPYPFLLLTQIVLIVLMAAIALGAVQGHNQTVLRMSNSELFNE